MIDLGVLQEGRVNRAALQERTRRRRWRRAAGGALLVVVLAVATLLAAMAPRASKPGRAPGRAGASHAGTTRVVRAGARQTGYGAAPALARARVSVRLKLPVLSGLLFDVRTGHVLWALDPERILPIASLTKMMTALVVTERARFRVPVRITREALHYSGSGVGLLPLDKRVPVTSLLYGLLLPSGNDAAIALAQDVAGNQARFVALMNARAQAMSLRCTHFTSASGIIDQGNHSCATDLAALAHAVLRHPLLAQIVGSASAVLPFPIKGGKLYLYNNNPLLRLGYPGTDGVKTGYTLAAGRCLVATARHGRKWLGVVLLHSADPFGQAQQLLNAGFAALGTAAGA